MPAPRVHAPRPTSSGDGGRPDRPGDESDSAFWGDDRPRRRPGRAPSALERWADLVRSHSFEVRGTVAIVVLVALVAGFVWFRVGSAASDAAPGAVRTSTAATQSKPATRRASPSAGPASVATTRGRGATMFVHVAGAVQKPGVIELPVGARVIDALDAVGGALADADLDRLNLAAKVVDGQQILVPKLGQPLPSGASGTSGAATGGVTGPVNLNTASATELETLPGIGPVLAAAIVSERERRGGFRSVNELRQVRGIGEARFTDLKPLVTV